MISPFLCLRNLRAADEVLGLPPGAAVLSQGRSTSKPTRIVIGRISFWGNSWTEGLRFSLAVDQKPPSNFYLKDIPMWPFMTQQFAAPKVSAFCKEAVEGFG